MEKIFDNSFAKLDSGHVLDSVELALERTHPGERATGSILSLNSLENRVFQMGFEDGLRVVTKFYRPNRWTEEQILEEHDFLFELEDLEIPVVAPLILNNDSSLQHSDRGFSFTVFPSVGGRLVDEPSTEQLQILGRYLARIHSCSETISESSRMRLDADTFGKEPLGFLMKQKVFETEAVRQQYFVMASRVIALADQFLKHADYLLVHGDCHLGNTLWDQGKPFFLDFDDLCFAPAVQDIWMVVRGRDEEAERQRETLVEAYDQIRVFPKEELYWIEALRGLRIIHYSAWIAKRLDDSLFRQHFPHFGKTAYWQDEISELQKICDFYQA